MQTIARANRVYGDKVSGLIVDYVGVFRNLERALAIYGVGVERTGKGKRPVEDKAALVAALESAVEETQALCRKRGVDLEAIEDSGGFERIGLLDDAVDALVARDERKKRFLEHAAGVERLYKAVLPDPAVADVQPLCVLIRVLAEKVRGVSAPADISEIMQQVEGLLDASIAAEGYVIREPSGSDASHLVDLSDIDFEALRARFEQGRKHVEAEKVKGLVARQLGRMVRLNRTRLDYLERFQQMIEAYNSGSVNVEEFFSRLMDFAKSLTEEEQRAVSEQLSEEELALFDLLVKPSIELTEKERAQVKKTARTLLDTLKHGKLVLDWRKRQQARAQVRVAIETVLDQGLPRAYTPELYQQKSDQVYQHVFDNYFGSGRSVYGAAA